MRLRGVALAVSLMTSAAVRLATAQTAQTTQTTAPADQAKSKWQEGASALARGDAEAARKAFKQAYELLPSPELAQGLGEVEFRTGHYADAVRHLTNSLESQKLSAEERKSTNRSLQKALAKVASLFIEVNVTSAELIVDGEQVGAVPRRNVPWYLDAGVHSITIHKDHFIDAIQQVNATEGESSHLSFTLSSELAGVSVLPPMVSPSPKDIPQSAPIPPTSEPEVKGEPPPPPRFFIAESSIALACIGTGLYFELKPDQNNNDKALGAGFLGSGGLVAVGTFVLWLATRPSSSSTPLPAARSGVTFGPTGIRF